MKVFPFIFAALVIPAIGGCEDSPAWTQPKAVIEGTIEDGGFPEVLFSSSVVPSVSGNLEDAIINWGKVTISDGEREVVLTGRVDTSCLPPFRYYSQEITGEPGKVYKVTVKYGNLYAEAAAVMPWPTPIDSLSFASTSVDTLRAVTLHFTSPDDSPAYYYLTLRRNQRNSRPGPCLMGTICADQPNTHYSLPVLRPKVNLNVTTENVDNVNGPYVPQLISGEEWTVRLNRVEPVIYEFWRAYDNMMLFSASPFISADESLPSNVSGGLGVWSPQGSASFSFKVP